MHENKQRPGSASLQQTRITDHHPASKSEIGLQLGSYKLRRLLRRGSVTTIYLGEHQLLGNRAVLKVLNSWVTNEQTRRSFYAEARLHANMRHPNIIRLLDFSHRNGQPFLVMDYAPNGSLYEYFPLGMQVQPGLLLPFVSQIASALQYLHDRNLVHRDVKPQNILLGNNHEVLLSDFGITIAAQPWGNKTEQESLGTALYAAPEQIERHALTASDQYALAALLYCWLCGVPPFEGTSQQLCQQHLYRLPPPLRLKVPALAPEVERVILRGLAKDPYQRFPSVQHFVQALEEAVRYQPESTL